MTPLLLLVLGPILLAEALLARYEVMAYAAGRRTAGTELPQGMPYARGADPDRPPAAYLVYLDGIGKRRFHDTRDGGRLVKNLINGAPELRVLGQVQPYSPLAAATGLGWWAAAGCVAVAGAGLGVAVEVVRRLVARIGVTGVREMTA